MLPFTIKNGSPVFPPSFICAVIRHAQRQALLVKFFIDEITEGKPDRFPSVYLLELGAVLELGMWERGGLKDHIADELPPYAEAFKTLDERLELGPSEFDGPYATPLSQQVLIAWINNFAWDADQSFGAEMLLGQVEREEFVDQLASFLIEHHRELDGLLGWGE